MKLSPLEAVKAVSSRQHTSVGGGTNPAAIAESSDFNNKMAPPPMQTSPSSMDWRRTERESNAATSSSSQSYLTQLAKWDHARGVKQEGCPCCDADNLSNAMDMIMMLYPLVFLFGGSWPSTRSRSFSKIAQKPPPRCTAPFTNGCPLFRRRQRHGWPPSSVFRRTRRIS